MATPDTPGISSSEMMFSGKNLGLAAILFFSAKGLAWLMVPLLFYMWGC
jgi:hypothetical protein